MSRVGDNSEGLKEFLDREKVFISTEDEGCKLVVGGETGLPLGILGSKSPNVGYSKCGSWVPEVGLIRKPRDGDGVEKVEIFFDELPDLKFGDVKPIEILIDPKTGQLLDGQVDVPSGKINVSKIDPKSGKLRYPLDKKRGKVVFVGVDPKTLILKPGQFGEKDNVIMGAFDPAAKKLVHGKYDTIRGTFITSKLRDLNVKPGALQAGKEQVLEMPEKVEVSFEELPDIKSVDSQTIELQIDPESGRLLEGQVDVKTGKINPLKFNLLTGKLRDPVDERFGKIVHAIYDPRIMMLKPGQIDEKDGTIVGKIDPKTLKLGEIKYDPKSGTFIPSATKSLIGLPETKFTTKEFDGRKLEKTDISMPPQRPPRESGELQIKKMEKPTVKLFEVQYDPQTGIILGSPIDLTTGKINTLLFDKHTGKLKNPDLSTASNVAYIAVDCKTMSVVGGQIDLESGTLKQTFNPDTTVFEEIKMKKPASKSEQRKTNIISQQPIPATQQIREEEPTNRDVLFEKLPDLKSSEMKAIELQIDPQTGKLLDGQIDLKTGKINTSKIDPKTGRLKQPTDKRYGRIVYVVIDPKTNTLKPGQIDEKDGTLTGTVDPKTKKIIQVKYDPKSGSFTPGKIVECSNVIVSHSRVTTNVPLTREFISFEEVPQEFYPDMRVIELQVDPKYGKVLKGQVDLNTGQIDPNILDMNTGKLKHPIQGRFAKTVHVIINPHNMCLKPGQIDLDDGSYIGRIDPKTLELFEVNYDPETERFIKGKLKAIFDKPTATEPMLQSKKETLTIQKSKSKPIEEKPEEIFELKFEKLPDLKSSEMKAIELQIDPQTGKLLDGQIDLKTGKINTSKIDPKTGRLKQPTDKRYGRIVYVVIDPKTNTLKPGQIDEKDGTLTGTVDPKTKKIIQVKYDPKSGSFTRGNFVEPQKVPFTFTEYGPKFSPTDRVIAFEELGTISDDEMKAIELQIDPETGKLLEGQVDLKTGKVYENKVDPKTGKLKSPVDKKFGRAIYAIVDPKIFTLKPGQFDERDGTLTGSVDPNTRKLMEVKYDPRTGGFIPGRIKEFIGNFPFKCVEPEHDVVIKPDVSFEILKKLNKTDKKAIELQIDPETGKLLDGQVDLKSSRIDPSKFDLKTGKLKEYVDPKFATIIYAVIDPRSNLLLRGQFDERDGAMIGCFDPQRNSVIDIKYDPKSRSFLQQKSVSPSPEKETKHFSRSDPQKKGKKPADNKETKSSIVDSSKSKAPTPETGPNYEITGKTSKRQFPEKELLYPVKNVTSFATPESVHIKKGGEPIAREIERQQKPYSDIKPDGKLTSQPTYIRSQQPVKETEPKPEKESRDTEKPDAGTREYYWMIEKLPDLKSSEMKAIELQIDPQTGKLLDGQIDLKTGKINTSKIDPKTGRLKQPTDKRYGRIVYVVIDPKTNTLKPGQIDEKDGTLTGTVDPKTKKIIQVKYDPKSGRFIIEKCSGLPSKATEVNVGFEEHVTFDEMPVIRSDALKAIEVQIDPRTGQILEGQIDLKSGRLIPMQFDLQTGKLKAPVDKKRGKIVHVLIDPSDEKVLPGQIDLTKGLLIGKIDPATRKIKRLQYDPASESFISSGEFEVPKLTSTALEHSKEPGLKDCQSIVSYEHIPSLDTEDVKAIELQIDPLTGQLIEGQIDIESGKINVEKYNLASGKLLKPVDKKHGLTIHAIIDSNNLKLIPGQFDDKTGKIMGRINPKTFKIHEIKYDPTTKNFYEGGIIGYIEVVTQTVPAKEEDSFKVEELITPEIPQVTGREDAQILELEIDPNTGKLLPGQIDLKTGKISEMKFDLRTGKLLHPVSENKGRIIYVLYNPDQKKLLPGQFNEKDGTFVGIYDPRTLKLISIRFDPITKNFYKERKSTSVLPAELPKGAAKIGRPTISFDDIPVLDTEDVKPIEVQIDPQTGCLLPGQINLVNGKIVEEKFDLVTGKLKKPVDRRCGLTIHAIIDPNNYKLIPGQFDEKSGKLIGRINPKTFKIHELEYDPNSGNFYEGRIIGYIEVVTQTVPTKEVEERYIDPQNIVSFGAAPVIRDNDLCVLEMQVDPETGKLLDGQINLRTGRIVEQKFDLPSGKLKNPVSERQGKLIYIVVNRSTKTVSPGQFDPKDGMITSLFDGKTGKYTNVIYNRNSRNFYFLRPKKVRRDESPKAKAEKLEVCYSEIPVLDTEDVKAIEVEIDPKTGLLLADQIDLKTGQIMESKYDFDSGKLKKPIDKRTGLTIYAMIDPNNKTLIPGQFNEKTGKVTGRINPRTFKIHELEYNPTTTKFYEGRIIGYIEVITQTVPAQKSDTQEEPFLCEPFPAHIDSRGVKMIELQIDPQTGRLVEGLVDLRTSKLTESKYDSRSGNLINPLPESQAKKIYGAIDPKTKKLLPGQFDDRDGSVIAMMDPKTFKLVTVTYDPKTRNFYITRPRRTPQSERKAGVPKTQISFSGIPSLDTEDVKPVEVQIDPRTGVLLDGQIDLTTGKINEAKYNLVTGELKSPVDKEHGLTIHAIIDPNNNKLIPGQFDEKTGKVIGRINPKTFKIHELEYDPKTQNFYEGRIIGYIEVVTQTIPGKDYEVELTQFRYEDLPTVTSGSVKLVQLEIDPKTGRLLDGQIDLKSGKIHTSKFDLATGKLKVPVEKESGKTIYVLINIDEKKLLPGQIDEADGKVVGCVHPLTLDLFDVYYDPKTRMFWSQKAETDLTETISKVSEINIMGQPYPTSDLKSVELLVDSKTGRILENQIDLKTGKINESRVDPNTGKQKIPAEAKHGKIVCLVIDTKSKKLLPGQVDEKDGKLIGKIDPKTLRLIDVDYDNKTGSFLGPKLKRFGDKISHALQGRGCEVDMPEVVNSYVENPPALNRDDVMALELLIDPNTGKLLPGQINFDSGNINESTFDIHTGKWKRIQKRSGKSIYVIMDKSKRSLLPGQINHDGYLVGRIDAKTSKIIPVEYDPKTGSFWSGNVSQWFGKYTTSPEPFHESATIPTAVEVIMNQIPQLDRNDLMAIQLEVDPQTGILVPHQLDESSGEINDDRIDLKTGKVKNPTGEIVYIIVDPTSKKPLVGQLDKNYQKVTGKIDPKTFEIIDVNYDAQKRKFFGGRIKGRIQITTYTVSASDSKRVTSQAGGTHQMSQKSKMKKIEKGKPSSEGSSPDDSSDYEDCQLTQDKDFSLGKGKLSKEEGRTKIPKLSGKKRGSSSSPDSPSGSSSDLSEYAEGKGDVSREMSTDRKTRVTKLTMKSSKKLDERTEEMKTKIPKLAGRRSDESGGSSKKGP
ncbi:hypothetical protein RUM43_015004 [Polyplax serrata]|uniref:Uncharacterized protein n=1 Tax=Polyplax serrata TaxID=468196 RepID=A0AAN8P4A6_POLSC